MKTKLAILFCVVALQVSAQTPTIEINRDSTFLLRDVLRLDNNQYIYGEKYLGVQYGGEKDDNFNKKQVEPNKKEGVTITRDSTKQIQISVVRSLLENDSLTLEFCKAYKDQKLGWCADSKNKVSLILINIQKENKSESKSDLESKSDSESMSEESMSEESMSEESMSEESSFLQNISDWFYQQRWNLTIGAFLILTLSFIFYVILIKKELRIKSKTMSSFKEEMESEMKRLHHLIEKSKDKADAKTPSVSLTRSDIEKLIDARLTKNVLAKQGTDLGSSSIQDKKPLLVENIDTANVEWNSEDMSFKLGNPEFQIFRIYSRNNHYFYTIVSDDGVRKELVSMIAEFSAFFTSESTLTNAQRVEPLEDGKLIKEGDIYRVDPNNKMKVRFV